MSVADVISTPLQFRNLTVKNRVFRSNISGRFDNEDGSLTQTRINWETKFAQGGVEAIISSRQRAEEPDRLLRAGPLSGPRDDGGDADVHLPRSRRSQGSAGRSGDAMTLDPPFTAVQSYLQYRAWLPGLVLLILVILAAIGLVGLFTGHGRPA